MGTLQGIDNSASIGELSILLFQFFVFSWNQGCFLNLIDLKFQKSHFPILLLFVHIKGFQFCLTFLIFLIGSFHLLFFRKDFLTAISVQDFQLFLLIEKGLVLMLSVNVKKTGCSGLHLADSACLPIYLINAPAVHDLS